ncbi:hypothetical protein F4802DRAFT_580426 [Xylaria palmicola]|nr:hypothetical protein F4802DRAFT_580426 [Xylaria palmicola]
MPPFNSSSSQRLASSKRRNDQLLAVRSERAWHDSRNDRGEEASNEGNDSASDGEVHGADISTDDDPLSRQPLSFIHHGNPSDDEASTGAYHSSDDEASPGAYHSSDDENARGPVRAVGRRPINSADNELSKPQFAQPPPAIRLADNNAKDYVEPPRQKVPLHITISQDRSKGSQFEQYNQRLIALESRERQQNNAQLTPYTQYTGNDPLEPFEFRRGEVLGNSEIPNISSTTDAYQEVKTSGQPIKGNDALSNYQAKLLLLEQQNRRRLMLARAEEDAINELPSIDTRLTSNPPIRRRYTPSPTQYQQSGNHNVARPNDGSGRYSPGSDSTAQVNSNPTIDVRALGIPAEATVSLDAVRRYIADLQERCGSKETIPVKYRLQIIHRIIDGSKKRLYLDRPQWTGEENRSKVLLSSVPVSNILAYFDRHPEVIFVVYRDYDLSVLGNGDEHSDMSPLVDHTSESIEPATKELGMVISRFLEYNSKPMFWERAKRNSKPRGLDAPYLGIYHSRHLLEAFLGILPSRQQLQFWIFVNYVLSQYSSDYANVDMMLKSGKITNRHIAYLFKPGDLLVEGKGQNIRAYWSKSWPVRKKVPNFKKASVVDSWVIDCKSWGYSGSFKLESKLLDLELDSDHQAERNIDDLPVRPLSLASEDAERLRRRGEMFWKCRIRRFVSYHEDPKSSSHRSGDERFIIDFNMYRELHKREEKNKLFFDENLEDDLGSELMEKDNPPNDTFLYLLPPTIKGYSLKRKKWLDLNLDLVSDVVWNKDAFESLVLDNKTKRLIRALVSNQLEAEKSTDLISGKGNGLILLLHGGPGTGKTLTAESVAEIAEKPLYPVTCGDIGTEPELVEMYLESVLHLGKTWGCVVLLDEADVFLEQRRLEDLQRNALVSVFLRVLEYYDGMLILTSNRVGTFDEAFKSRIQLALHYPNLGAYQREKIWENFIARLERLGEPDVDFGDLRRHVGDLARHKMNGRQIRNAITTARQYAKWARERLDYKLMEDIIETAGRFEIYIEKLNGGYSQDQLAEDEGLRLAGTV